MQVQAQARRVPQNLILNTFFGVDELVINVFKFLNGKDLCQSVMPTCQKWRELAKDDQLWKRIIQAVKPHILKEIPSNNVFSHYVEFQRCLQNMQKNKWKTTSIKLSNQINRIPSCTFRGSLYVLGSNEIKKYCTKKKKFSTWKVLPRQKGQFVSFQCDLIGNFLILRKEKSGYKIYKVGESRTKISKAIDTENKVLAAYTAQVAYWFLNENQIIQKDFWTQKSRCITCKSPNKILKLTVSHSRLFVERSRGQLSIYSEKKLQHIVTKKIAGKILTFTQEFIFAFCPRYPTFIYKHSISSQAKTVKLSLGNPAQIFRGLTPTAQVVGDTFLVVLYHFTAYLSRYGIPSKEPYSRSIPIRMASLEILNFRTGENVLQIDYGGDTPKQLHSSIEKIVVTRSNTFETIDFLCRNQKQRISLRSLISRVIPCI